MNLAQYIDALKKNPAFMQNVTHWREMPARAAKYADFPDSLDARIQAVLRERGIQKLYSHQRHAWTRWRRARILWWLRPRPRARPCATIFRF